MVDENDKLVIIDLGMALRVPYCDPCNPDGVTDVSEGTERLLIQAQGQGGKLMYLAPEIIARDAAFDGFAVDLWAAGVVLFVTLVGLAPFKWAHESDRRYAKIAKGQLKHLLHSLKIMLSDEACDLLQNMFWRDPRKRLTLAQVMEHPWVLDQPLELPKAPSNENQCKVAPVSQPSGPKPTWFPRNGHKLPTLNPKLPTLKGLATIKSTN
jgi:serine/threonine protein kinase